MGHECRGGYASLDASDKATLSAAWKNWLYIAAAGGVAGSIYYPYASKTDFYNRQSEYIRKTYLLFQILCESFAAQKEEQTAEKRPHDIDSLC